jgi:hypothetical protein
MANPSLSDKCRCWQPGNGSAQRFRRFFLTGAALVGHLSGNLETMQTSSAFGRKSNSACRSINQSATPRVGARSVRRVPGSSDARAFDKSAYRV